MSPSSGGPVVIDTGVFGARLTPSGKLLASSYRPLVEGRREMGDWHGRSSLALAGRALPRNPRAVKR